MNKITITTDKCSVTAFFSTKDSTISIQDIKDTLLTCHINNLNTDSSTHTFEFLEESG